MPRGENAGKTLQHANVVRAFKTSSPDADGAGKVELTLPVDFANRGASIIAYAQHKETMHVTGAAAAELQAQ